MHRGGASSLLSIMDNSSVGNETTEHNVGDQNTKHNQHEDLSTSSQPMLWFPSITDSKKRKVGLQLKDLYNARRDDREMRKGQDAHMLIENFEQQNQRNPAFIYHYEVDANNYLSRVFWADATCRMNYGYFGDTVVFDTAYKTNKYNMIFATFKGVNHHYQSVYFGFAFLHDETTESFCWLFKKFLESMPGDAPKSIITDQDPAMANEISQIFPNTFHRWCIWHITQKLPNKLGSKLYRGDFSVSFHDLINNCETPEEFEIKWHDLMQQYELDDDNWLKELYDKRYKWVNAYLKHIFFAGMTSSQRSESHHSALQKMISPHHSFMDFVAMLKLILSQQKTNELQADQESITYKSKVKTPSLLEVHMADVYTTRIFYMFQEEFLESGFGYSCHMVSQDENKGYYNVQRLLVNNKGRTVVFDRKIQYLTCSCKKFEFQGIPCRHLLLVLRNVGINDLPSLYILKRWCKDAKKGIIIDNTGQEILVTKRDTPQATRSRELQYIIDKLVEKGCTSEQKFELMKKNLEKMLAEFETTSIPNEDNQEINEEDNGICPVGSSSTVNQVIFVKEPSHYRLKGCGERFKSRMEKIMPKPRLCRACGKRGVQHDSRNCPDKIK